MVAAPTRLPLRHEPAGNVPSASTVLEKAAQENFPVASRVLPARLRRGLLAVYGFARLVDDIGDEATGDRGELLDWVEEELDRASAGGATHPLMVRVGETIEHFGLPLAPFRDLVAANRQDQVVSRYETFDALLEYCMLSAAPVGRLVLGIFGAATPQRCAWSDEVCNALQIVEHLQDVHEDAARGRIYLPLEDLDRFGCDPEDLLRPSASRGLRRVVVLETARARRMLRAAGPLAGTLPVRQRVAVAAFAAGGLAALDEIARRDYDVLAHRCHPRSTRLVLRCLTILGASLA